MSTLIKAAQQALEALEKCKKALAEELSAWDIDPPLHHVLEAHDLCDPAITSLRQAIEQAERFDKQPTKILSTEKLLNSAGFYKAEKQEPVAWQVHPFDYGIGHEGVYARTDRPEQVEMWKRKGWAVQPLYTTPQPQQAEKQEPVAFNAGVPPLYPEMKDGETISVEYTTPPAAPVQQQKPVCWDDEDKCPNRQACCDAEECLYTAPQPQEFVCSTGLCHFTLTQTNVGIGERGMEAYEAAKERGWVGLSDERLMKPYQGDES